MIEDWQGSRQLTASRLPSPSVSMLFSTQHRLLLNYQGIRFLFQTMAQASFYRVENTMKNPVADPAAISVASATPMRPV